MRSLMIVVLVKLLQLDLFAQNSTSLTDSTQIFMFVEQMPEFPGGEDSMNAYIRKKIRYPQKAMDLSIDGIVYVEFVVNEDGKISNVQLKEGVYTSLDNEALRVVSSFPIFKPGRQNGKPVKVVNTIPISFKMEGKDTTEFIRMDATPRRLVKKRR